MDWKSKIQEARQTAGSMLDQQSEKAVEEHWPQIQKVFQEKVGPAALAAAQNDKMLRSLLENVYTAFMTSRPILRFAIKKEAFVMFCFKHRDRLIKENVQTAAKGEING